MAAYRVLVRAICHQPPTQRRRLRFYLSAGASEAMTRNRTYGRMLNAAPKTVTTSPVSERRGTLPVAQRLTARNSELGARSGKRKHGSSKFRAPRSEFRASSRYLDIHVVAV